MKLVLHEEYGNSRRQPLDREPKLVRLDIPDPEIVQRRKELWIEVTAFSRCSIAVARPVFCRVCDALLNGYQC